MKTTVTIGYNNFADLRRKAHLKQADVAQLVGVSSATLCRIEMRGGKMSKEVYDNLVKLFGEPVIYKAKPSVKKVAQKPVPQTKDDLEDFVGFMSHLYRSWKASRDLRQ